MAELCARLTLLDVNDNFVAYLGDNDAICTNDGWPNSKDTSGEIVPTGLLTPGKSTVLKASRWTMRETCTLPSS